jgi:UDP-N-acetyl-D-glucosamine 2-epimerase, UDP-hydrolysing
MTKRKICVVTGTRAEYGLLYWIMKEVQQDKTLDLQLIVTGMHLSPEFGLTYQTIEKDGFTINKKVEMLLSSDTAVGVTKSIGLGVIGFADALEQLKPDIMLVLGDRYELLAAVQAALVANIVIAHIHGGETTEGVIDEGIRHAITKMSQIHFTASELYRKRVIQMGEQPSRVFDFGAPGLDNITRLDLWNRKVLEQSIGFDLTDKFFLVTYHPVTVEFGLSERAMNNLFEALDAYDDYKILITKPNADTGGRIIGKMIDNYRNENPSRVCVHTSLGQVRYLSAMNYCAAVVGNSSSGLIEAPVLKKATVNIGDRQLGRLKAESVIDCTNEVESIKKAIEKAVSDDFKECLLQVKSLYGFGEASIQIKNILKTISLKGIMKKKFYDIDL